MPFDATSYIMGRNSASGGGGGGGGDITVEPLEVTDNGTYTADEGKAYSPVTVNVPKGGGGDSAPENDVIFIDYDGTITNSYTKDEFLALSAMPENPTHDGLISQGWNWSFADAQEYVSKYGMLVVGQMYITDDGKTRLYIHIADIARNDVPVYFTQTVSNGVTIDWGDGSPTETSTGAGARTDMHHVYAAVGDYVITLDPADGCELGLGTGASNQCLLGALSGSKYAYSNMLQRAEIGKNTSMTGNAFLSCSSLQYVAIPNTSTIFPNDTFRNCFSLESIVIPFGTNIIGEHIFQFCYTMQRISLPNGVVEIETYAISSCQALDCISIPSTVTVIGSYAMAYNSAIKRIILPENLTTLPGYMCTAQYTLGTVIIPINVSSIPAYAFQNCYSLLSVTIPENVTAIITNAFNGCSSLGAITFKRQSPPSVASATSFRNIPTDCKIYVPTGSLAAYKSATNYPNPSTYTYIEY